MTNVICEANCLTVIIRYETVMSFRCFKLEPNGAMKQYERGNAERCQVAGRVEGQSRGRTARALCVYSTTTTTVLFQLSLFVYNARWRVSYRKRTLWKLYSTSSVVAASSTEQLYCVSQSDVGVDKGTPLPSSSRSTASLIVWLLARRSNFIVSQSSVDKGTPLSSPSRLVLQSQNSVSIINHTPVTGQILKSKSINMNFKSASVFWENGIRDRKQTLNNSLIILFLAMNCSSYLILCNPFSL